MMRLRFSRVLQAVCSLVAILFGIATIVAGMRALGGVNPGYVVFQPLLVYNTAMGLAYVVAGVMAWYSLDRGKYAAAAIFVLNLLVLAAIGYLYAGGAAVAIDSVYAMTVRTGVWLALLLGLAWLGRRNALPDGRHSASS